MKFLRTFFILLTVLTLLLGLAACGSGAPKEAANSPAAEPQRETEETAPQAEPKTEAAETDDAAEPESMPAADPEASEEPAGTAAEETDSAEQEPAAHSEVLVAYFSATGTTKGVAEKIAAITGGDLYEILAAEPYTSDDLNYNDRSSRSTKEQNDPGARPEIGSGKISLEGYTTVYLGFPIWWGEEPRILDTFVESCSFEGITVIPFCTSASSGIGRSGPNMEALAGSGTWLEGKRFGGNVSEEELRSWIEGLR